MCLPWTRKAIGVGLILPYPDEVFGETRDYISHVSGVVLWVNPLSAYTQMSLLAPRNRVVRFAPLNNYLAKYRQLVRAAAPSAIAAAAGAGLNRMSRPRYGRASLVQSSSSAPLTGHFDYKTDYARRRKSKRARRVGAAVISASVVLSILFATVPWLRRTLCGVRCLH